VRGDASDYNAWADLVKDPRWSYSGLLPYFRKTEHYHTSELDAEEHGFEGPLYTQSVSSTGRWYPLRQQVLSAWESVGVTHIADANSGSPQGISELVENLRDGIRQVASTVYPLSGVQVMTDTLVASIVIESNGTEKTAKGVKLADGRVFTTTEEVILSAGAIATPQLMMLSGIGSEKELSVHGITQIVDAPEVGQNFHGHMCVSQWWQLQHPEEGLAVGSAKFNYESLVKGFPGDWVITQTVPHEGLKEALAFEEGYVDDLHPLLNPPRSHTESFMVYVAANEESPAIALDGSHVTTTVMGMLPTSRGSVKLASNDPAIAPLIDPNYYATMADRYVMRTGLRKMMEVMMDTNEGKAMVKGETVAHGRQSLNQHSSDEEIDELVKERGK
jgi:choline dehydrogenase-like flavoprotein